MNTKKILLFILLVLNINQASCKVYYTFEKSNGKFIFNWFNSYVGYSIVEETVYHVDEHTIKHLYCADPGREKCRNKSVGTGVLRITNDSSFPENFIQNIINDLHDMIDENLINEIFEGKHTKKILAKSIEGENCLLAFNTHWHDGDIEGNCKTIISIDIIY